MDIGGRTQPARHGTSRLHRFEHSSTRTPTTAPPTDSGPNVTGGVHPGHPLCSLHLGIHLALYFFCMHAGVAQHIGFRWIEHDRGNAGYDRVAKAHVALQSDGVTCSCRSRRVAGRNRTSLMTGPESRRVARVSLPQFPARCLIPANETARDIRDMRSRHLGRADPARHAVRASAQATPYPAPRVDATAPSRDVNLRLAFVFKTPLLTWVLRTPACERTKACTNL